MKNIKYILIGLVAILATESCNIDTVENPNSPTAESLLNGATLADLLLLTNGIESVMRNDMEFHYWTTSMVGREYYDLNATDPRYTGELLGAQGAALDNNGFLTTRSWASAYRTARNSINLEIAVDNSSATLTNEEINGFKGFAKTMRAYVLSLELQRQYQNGIRIDVTDPDNRGPIVSYNESLDALISLLDEGSSNLLAAGSNFAFSLSAGFTGFNTPSTFNEFNRAVKARLMMYSNNKGGVLTALENSFYDPDGDLTTGVYHSFGQSGNDIRNPLFNVADQDLYAVQQDWLDDAEEGDTRIAAKTRPFDSTKLDLPVLVDGLSGNVQVFIYPTDVTPVPMIRNEELILLYAEANIGSNNSEAVNAINVIRTAAGLDAYSGPTDDASLVDELLNQRRYSLFGEGHRWVDMRRYDRLDEIPTDRAGDVVHIQFPTPFLDAN